MNARGILGRNGEARAVEHLRSAGFRILERNWNCRAGELDVVARRGPLLLIVEVRLRTRQEFGGAAASITRAKQRRILRAARLLLRRRPALAALSVRFDVLLLTGADDPIEWIEGAFDAPDGST